MASILIKNIGALATGKLADEDRIERAFREAILGPPDT